jgi:hypothetical protein
VRSLIAHFDPAFEPRPPHPLFLLFRAFPCFRAGRNIAFVEPFMEAAFTKWTNNQNYIHAEVNSLPSAATTVDGNPA